MTNLTSEQYRDVLKHFEGTEKIPTVQNLLRKAVETFFLNFGGYPEFAGVAPGKIGIFGENLVDFGGLALSMAAPMATIIVGRRSEGPRFSVVTTADVGKPHKVSFSFSKNRPLGPGCPFWLNHIKGVIDSFKDEVIPPFEAAIESSIPIGSYLGSSSAVQLATYSFLEILLGVKSDDFEKVKACQEAEKYFALKEVGLLDRMTVNGAWDRHLMLIDVEHNDVRGLPFKSKNLTFVYIDSHFPNILEDTYVEDKNYFDTACKILNLDNLRKFKENDLDNLESKVTQIIEDNKVLQEAEDRTIKEAKSFVKGEESVLIPSDLKKSDSQKDQKKSETPPKSSKSKRQFVTKTIMPLIKNHKVEKKQLNFITRNVEGSKKEIAHLMPSRDELKSVSKSAEFEKFKKKIFTVDSRTRRDTEEFEEIEISEAEEGETEVKTEEYYGNMMDKVKFYVAEIKNVNEAADAWQAKDFENFGKKMSESHELLKDLNNFHLPILDFLVQTSFEVEGVLGSRMIAKSSGGGGVITLIKKKNIPEYCQYVIEKYKENEKELKEKCMSALYDLLLEKSKSKDKQEYMAASGSKILAALSGRLSAIKERKEKPTGKCPAVRCFPRRRSCLGREYNLGQIINPCGKDAKNLKKTYFDDEELKLRGKENLCEELKPKRCGTWSRRLKSISLKSTSNKEKMSQSNVSSWSSSDDNDSESKNVNGGVLNDSENGKNIEEGNDTANPRGISFGSIRHSSGAGGKKKSASEDNEKRGTSGQDDSAFTGENDAASADPAVLEQIEKIEKLADPTFYVVSPFPGTRMMFVTKTDILRSLYSHPVPDPKALLKSALKVFEREYDNKATSVGIAPGTLTLFGEFMEFQLGYIICMALTMVTVMVGGKNDSVNFSVKTTSDEIEHPSEMIYPIPCVRQLEIESRNWANFIMGTVSEFKGHVPGFNAVINSSLPIQMGLNSCAALQACAFTFLENLTGQCVPDPFEKADLCGKSEFDFHPHHSELVTRCSSVKFFPTFLCKEGHLMFINCKRYKITQYFFDHPSYVFVIASCKRITTNVTVESLDERLKKCVEALEILQRNSLLSTDTKHLKCLQEKGASPEIIKRVKYVISEHDRTIDAVKAIKNKDYERVGLLMSQSHASLRDDYEVSCPEIELLIKLAGEAKGVLGAKMVGKGLTSTIVILVNIFHVDECIRHIRKNYKPRFDRPQFYITKPSRGAFTMSPEKDVYNIP